MWNTETKINRKSNLEKARIALKGTLKKTRIHTLRRRNNTHPRNGASILHERNMREQKRTLGNK